MHIYVHIILRLFIVTVELGIVKYSQYLYTGSRDGRLYLLRTQADCGLELLYSWDPAQVRRLEGVPPLSINWLKPDIRKKYTGITLQLMCCK